MTIGMSANSCWYLYNFRRNTIKALLAANHTVVCIAPEDNYTNKLVQLGCTHQSLKLSDTGTSPLSELRSFIQLRAILRKIKPSILLTFNPKLNIYGGLAAATLRIHHIANISGLGSMNNRKRITRLAYLTLYKVALYSSKHIFFQNDRDQNLFCRFRIIDPSKASRIMGSGVDLIHFNYQRMPPAPPTRFVFIGRLIEEKGVRAYVEAASRLQKKYGAALEFSIIGILQTSSSSRSINASDLARWEREKNIKFRGAFDNITEALATDHVVVLPTTYSEGVPKVALEGASLGRIVITADLPGCRDTVEHGKTGFLCDPTQINSICNAMEQALNLDADARTLMGKAARLRMENLFNEKQNIEAYLTQIEI